MGPHDKCKHPETIDTCDETCICLCDACQGRFESAWNAHILEKNLCSICGIPKDITLQSLEESKGQHFYNPCDFCYPSYSIAMATANLCEGCRCPLKDNMCVLCVCVKPKECVCRACKPTPHN